MAPRATSTRMRTRRFVSSRETSRSARGAESISASSGTTVVPPSGLEHTYRVHLVSARLLTVLIPGGFESSYREVTWSSRVTGIEHLIAITAR